MRGEGGVGKSRVVKTIYLGFSFLKKRSELVIAVLIRVATANIRNATMYSALNIDGRMKNKK